MRKKISYGIPSEGLGWLRLVGRRKGIECAETRTTHAGQARGYGFRSGGVDGSWWTPGDGIVVLDERGRLSDLVRFRLASGGGSSILRVLQKPVADGRCRDILPGYSGPRWTSLFFFAYSPEHDWLGSENPFLELCRITDGRIGCWNLWSGIPRTASVISS